MVTVSSVQWECIGSVVECLTRDQVVAGSSLTGGTVLCLEQDTLSSS